jgi:hypothetical protein
MLVQPRDIGNLSVLRTDDTFQHPESLGVFFNYETIHSLADSGVARLWIFLLF